tara:strand:- start:905 stop:1312 length:408 start_codon:yes stop_codon:yes gene_type:complete
MKKIIFFIVVTFLSLEFYSAPYEDEVRKRLGLLKNKPVVAMSSLENSDNTTSIARSGESVYNLGCAACHTAGLAGAPMLGNISQWQGRVEKGLEVLTNNSYNGYNAMPAKGLCMDCTEEEMQNAVQYMLDALTVE